MDRRDEAKAKAPPSLDPVKVTRAIAEVRAKSLRCMRPHKRRDGYIKGNWFKVRLRLLKQIVRALETRVGASENLINAYVKVLEMTWSGSTRIARETARKRCLAALEDMEAEARGDRRPEAYGSVNVTYPEEGDDGGTANNEG